ncbi:HNH endonuclease [Deinococcus humi]|uniref:5-methylcytosine-specific restriction endonuclease McrA n=1 Tax=Deinococcus humi TaxID=662880 RepID=A0A7W8NCE1_9DEIO|nr:HNH endonuclease signature motif containing protein [Deinococcus humi]MBB5362069.1 5-methylcytosine-specific restriction endonuclease McrA [Deinococcus humi]
MAIPELAEKERQSKRESQAKRLREDPAFRLRRREESRLRSQRASADPVKRQVLNERSRNYFQRNRETQLAKQREYNRLNPEKIREQNARTRARRQNLEGEYTGHDLKRILLAQGFKCFYCGDVIRNGPRAWHADHFIPVARGGTNHPENIVIACAGCNLSKHDKLPWEWMPERFSPGPSQMS